MKKKHPFYSGLQPLQGFVPQNPAKDQSDFSLHRMRDLTASPVAVSQ